MLQRHRAGIVLLALSFSSISLWVRPWDQPAGGLYRRERFRPADGSLLGGIAFSSDEYIAWIGREIGQAPQLAIGDVCRDDGAGRYCLRGVLATADIQKGEIIVKIPLEMSVQLGDASQPGGMTAGVRQWLEFQHEGAGASRLKPYLDILPRRGDILGPETYSSAELQLLQGGELEQRVRSLRRAMEGSYAAEAADPGSIVTRAGLGLEDYAHAWSQVATRCWGFLDDPRGELVREQRPANSSDPLPPRIWTMVPLIDMPNHRHPGNNAAVDRRGDQVLMQATREIAKGEEVTVAYQAGLLHRPDIALLHYGFLPKRQPPILAAHDMPGGTPQEREALQTGTTQTLEDDMSHYPWDSAATLMELLRLQNHLDNFPTTEAEDRALLKNASLTWREKLLLEFRVERKAALSHVIGMMSQARESLTSSVGAAAGSANAARALASGVHSRA